MNRLARPSPDMRARLLAAARQTPASRPGAWRRRLTGVGLFALCWTLLAAFVLRLRPDWGELPSGALSQTFAGLGAVVALASGAGLARGKTMTGAGVEKLVAVVAVGVTVLLVLVMAVDPTGPSTKSFTGAAMATHAIPCELLVLALGLPLLGAGLLPLAGLTLSRPGLTGSCLGLAAATISHLVVRCHCSVGGAGHAFLGHLLPALPLMLLGAWACRARVIERIVSRFGRSDRAREEKL
ncbi:MAG TPA: NrsF family protein [Polyangia bacterium]|jgi:hypothetical protein